MGREEDAEEDGLEVDGPGVLDGDTAAEPAEQEMQNGDRKSVV